MDTNSCSRRDFLRSTTALGVGVMALGVPRLASARPYTRLRVLSIGVIGTIGGTDRRNVHAHPLAEIVGRSRPRRERPPRWPGGWKRRGHF